MKPYHSDRSKTEEVRSMFDAIACNYDRLNHLLSLGIDRSWRRKMVRRVTKSGAQKILDIATGTGDLAILMAQCAPDASIEGIDLSEQMLLLGRKKVAQKGLQERIKLVQGDAEKLESEENCYDAVTIAFGIRNFEHIERGLEEVFRVLKPGGKLFVLEFGTPHIPVFGWLYRWYFHRILPTIGRIISGEGKAYTYLPQSVDKFPAGEGFCELMQKSGLSNNRLTHLLGGVAQIYEGEK